MKTHEIKLNIEFCDDVYNGNKTCEIRKNDRGYKKGDRIKFTAFSPERIVDDHPINKELYEITYVLSGWGIEKDFVVFAVRRLEQCKGDPPG